jgi:hypothetical protein
LGYNIPIGYVKEPAMNNTLTIDGREYRASNYKKITFGCFFLTGEGKVKKADSSAGYSEERFLMVEPIPVRYTFGGVVFQETGEVRTPEVGEWWLCSEYTKAALMTDDRPLAPKFVAPIVVPISLA